MTRKRLFVNLVLIFSCFIFGVVIWHISIVTPSLFSSSLFRFNKVVSYTLNKNNFSYIYPLERLHPFDYTRLMNKGFAFSMLSACDSDLLLLVTVFSLPWRIGQRISIRETWGKSVGKDVKVVFIIGNIDDIIVRTALEEENKRYEDLVQGKFLDVSLYNTYKYITAFKYAIYHCPRTRYILKVNDDVFVNINAMLDFIYEQLSPYGAKKLLLCTPLAKPEEKRLRIKWIAPFPEYNDAYYPPYCQEWSSPYSSDVIFTLYEELQKMRHFWVEELLTTGVLAKHANIPCISTGSLTLYRYAVDKILEKSKWDNTNKTIFLYAEPSILAKEMRLLWRIFKYPLRNIKSTTTIPEVILI